MTYQVAVRQPLGLCSSGGGQVNVIAPHAVLGRSVLSSNELPALAAKGMHLSARTGTRLICGDVSKNISHTITAPLQAPREATVALKDSIQLTRKRARESATLHSRISEGAYVSKRSKEFNASRLGEELWSRASKETAALHRVTEESDKENDGAVSNTAANQVVKECGASSVPSLPLAARALAKNPGSTGPLVPHRFPLLPKELAPTCQNDVPRKGCVDSLVSPSAKARSLPHGGSKNMSSPPTGAEERQNKETHLTSKSAAREKQSVHVTCQAVRALHQLKAAGADIRHSSKPPVVSQDRQVKPSTTALTESCLLKASMTCNIIRHDLSGLYSNDLGTDNHHNNFWGQSSFEQEAFKADKMHPGNYTTDYPRMDSKTRAAILAHMVVLTDYISVEEQKTSENFDAAKSSYDPLGVRVTSAFGMAIQMFDRFMNLLKKQDARHSTPSGNISPRHVLYVLSPYYKTSSQRAALNQMIAIVCYAITDRHEKVRHNAYAKLVPAWEKILTGTMKESWMSVTRSKRLQHLIALECKLFEGLHSYVSIPTPPVLIENLLNPRNACAPDSTVTGSHRSAEGQMLLRLGALHARIGLDSTPSQQSVAAALLVQNTLAPPSPLRKVQLKLVQWFIHLKSPSGPNCGKSDDCVVVTRQWISRLSQRSVRQASMLSDMARRYTTLFLNAAKAEKATVEMKPRQ